MRFLGALIPIAALAVWPADVRASEAQLCHNLRLDPPLRIEACTRAMADPNAAPKAQVDLLFARAMARDDLGDYARAIQDYDAAIVLAPNDPYLHLNRGVAKIHGGRPADAIADYDRAIQLKPDWHLPHFDRAVALADLGQRAAALQDFERAIALKPNDAWIYVGQGDVLSASADPEGALAAYDKALRIRPDLDDARAKRAGVLTLLDRPREAVRELDDVLTRHPGKANLWRARAEAQFQLAFYADAAADLRRSLDLAADKLVRRELVRAELAAGNPAGAWDAIAPALSDPDAADLAIAARAALQTGRAEMALDLATQASAVQPGIGTTEAVRAIALGSLGRVADAKAAAQLASEFAPRDDEIAVVALSMGLPTSGHDVRRSGATPADAALDACIRALSQGDRMAAQAAGAKWSLCHLAASF